MGSMQRLVSVAFATVLALSPGAASAPPPSLNSAAKWVYQLQGDVTSISSHVADIAVVDIDNVKSGAVLSAIKAKPDGGRRTVLSYLSIGEAETYRSYFKECCLSATPSWLTSTTQGWADNYLVRYWESEWKQIMKARLLAIVRAGFDGAYFDRVDSWEAFRDTLPTARQEMIALVRELAAAAREINPAFLIIVQNGEELLADASYLEVIDGIAKEDLFFGANHDRSRNADGMVRNSLRHLHHAKKNGKAVLVVEYGADAEAQAEIAAEIASHGFVPCLATRELDRIPVETP